MKTIFVDKYGNYTETEHDNTMSEIRIPLMIKYNNIFQTIVISIVNNHKYKNEYRRWLRKPNDKITWFEVDLVCSNLVPGLQQNWEYDFSKVTAAFTEELMNKIMYTANSVLANFIRVKCLRDGYISVEGMTTLNDEFYYRDTIIDRHKDSIVHLFGSGIILKRGLSNCILYIYGDYEVH